MTRRRSPFWRYLAFQVPGWLLAIVAAWWLYRAMGVPLWVATGLPVFWFVKDMALYPLLRSAYVDDDTPPVLRLVGARGRPVEPLAPHGYVRIGGELWRADAVGTARIEADDVVEVIDAEGLILQVRRVDDAG